jgi:ankyrin repeat protein
MLFVTRKLSAKRLKNSTFSFGCAHQQAVKLLVQNRADVRAVNKYGETPLHYAALDNDIALCKCLVDCGARPGAK